MALFLRHNREGLEALCQILADLEFTQQQLIESKKRLRKPPASCRKPKCAPFVVAGKPSKGKG